MVILHYDYHKHNELRAVYIKIYEENELLQGKLDILSKTNMVDYAIDIRKQLYPKQEVPETLKNRRVQVLSQLQELQNEVAPILKLLSDEVAMKTMETLRDSKALLNFLTKEHDGMGVSMGGRASSPHRYLPPESGFPSSSDTGDSHGLGEVGQFKVELMDSLFKLAKYRYECGNYSVPTSYLYFYMLVMPTTDKNYLNVLWGKLASEILVQNWDLALEDLNKLREFIDGSTFGSSLLLLHQRTWLIHWSLFVFFNHVKGRDLIIEMFLYRPQ
ncbi:unnamed protein product [Timema podura]|uniref:Eukaryotic translation initiation factor 3 subunit E N-terminal domain-containing protein n=1 Tax=Timema podura TaxID=61482 RepID=A0ABN7P0C7_TIMPD|nr:unnamed protein product [Timema podura]